jgi:hypothetical protein
MTGDELVLIRESTKFVHHSTTVIRISTTTGETLEESCGLPNDDASSP